MAYDNRLLKKFNLSGKPSKDKGDGTQEDEADMSLMSDPAYLRQSSALINDALQKGFDVLQLANGDIVTTGTKIVVSTYSWDEKKSKLTKAKSGSARRASGKVEEDESLLEDAE